MPTGSPRPATIARAVRWTGVGIEKQSVDYTFAADLPLPAAREITRLIGEGAELFEDEHRCTDCVVKQLTRALDRGERGPRSTSPPRPSTRVKPFRPPANEPIYAGLAVRWTAAGRVVPGQTDQEWKMLTSRRPWLNR
ncbi:hypothetical protein [Streptomyces sp. NPDC005571]|uniref:hypothetical protein n=1 Tax=Streptomyces sp. NPDC005571 TaxID=3156888 RepID=UPI0033A459E8